MAGHLALTSRRRFLSAGLVGLTLKAERNIGGSFVNESHALGHRLRARSSFKMPTRKVRIPLVIVGGGMAGLSAAWRLDKAGFRDFALLEMAPQAGGNSRWGENEISAYPWAAHYVPIPNRKSALVRELFEELGLLHDGKLVKLTRDHTVGERLVEDGTHAPTDPLVLELRGLLFQALGSREGECNPQVSDYSLHDDDQLLLCTDGLTDMVEEAEIERILNNTDSAKLSCRRLVDLALGNGGIDNVTVIVARYSIPPRQ